MALAELSRLTLETLYLGLLVSAPVLLTSLLVGTLIGLIQAVTQIQEFTLSFVPKLVAVALVLVISASWMSGQMVRFTSEIWKSIPERVK